MYAFSNSNRIYTLIFLCLCAAFFLAPSLANANDYWSVLDRRFIPQESVPNAVKEMLGHKVARPSGSTLSTVPSSPTISKNALGGLSATTNNILKTLDQPSTFSSTLNNSAASAKTALKSCLRSPACVGRALGTGAVIYEGIQGWKDVYDLTLGSNGVPAVTQPLPVSSTDPSGNTCYNNLNEYFPTCVAAFDYYNTNRCLTGEPQFGCPLTFEQDRPNRFIALAVNGNAFQYYTLMSDVCPSGSTNTANGCVSDTETIDSPVSLSELDDMVDEGYEPAVSDAPIVLLSGEPETISLTTPEPANLPATTTTSTDSQGKTTTTVKNSVITYNILNNNSSSPSIESTITETSNTYDDTANLVGSMTSTTTNNPVAPDPLPPSSGASADVEIPPFCTWASIVCDWIGWTKEPLDEEEPDLSQLITVFEPDEDGYDSGIGSGSCPASMMLNLAIINKTVEVKYDPFCDFLEMIRPFVLAAAYLVAAYLYIGVLRRG